MKHINLLSLVTFSDLMAQQPVIKANLRIYILKTNFQDGEIV